MSLAHEEVLASTESVCPECLARIPARQVMRGDDVYLLKICPEHGEFAAVVWRGEPAYSSWVRPKIPAYLRNPFTPVDRGCPYDCGLCPDHRQHTCTALLEVTQRCDLGCPFCFASSGDRTPDPVIEVVEGWYRRLLDAGGPYNIQLSGGEPCKRDDLPEIVALGRSLGFEFIQVNTNGVRLARDAGYLRRLRDAGLASVFLQFDGTENDIYRALRGRQLLADKCAAIERCAECGLGVVLVPTLVPGVNTHNIGDIVLFALEQLPAVRGVHFQPVSYFGRYPRTPGDGDRVTIPEVIRAIETQTDGLVPRDAFKPSGCENARCSFHANLVLMPDGSLASWTHHDAEAACCCKPKPADEGAARTRAFTARHWSHPQPPESRSCCSPPSIPPTGGEAEGHPGRGDD
ncbi:MAG: radical SAM protein, partial [Anaerolineae bacterium]|nr:radical SAM protein [Anaerolineae bacterium]